MAGQSGPAQCVTLDLIGAATATIPFTGSWLGGEEATCCGVFDRPAK